MARPLLANPLDVSHYLTLALPKSVKMPNGDSIGINWYDAEEVQDYVGYPYGTFYALPMPYQGNTYRRHITTEYGDTAIGETYTYTTGTADYPLQAADVFSTVSLVGKVSGITHTFTPGTDYSITDQAGYNTPSQVHWLSAIRPDTGTPFTYTFQPRRGQTLQIITTYPTYRLTVTCADIPTGANGATVPYSKTQVGQFISDYLLMFFRMNQGKGIGPNPRDLIIHGVVGEGPLPITQSESVRKYWMDLRLCRRMLPALEDFEFIGSTPLDIDVDGDGEPSAPGGMLYESILNSPLLG